jgi:hypothetical protein
LEYVCSEVKKKEYITKTLHKIIEPGKSEKNVLFPKTESKFQANGACY